MNKYIAEAGICSRRKADDAIFAGAVCVNGKVECNPAVRVKVAEDTVTFHGQLIQPAASKVYIAFNKPRGCVSTCSDERGRKTVLDFLGEYAKLRIFPVGRLDYDSDGLLLLTNDGDFAYCLTHPKHKQNKIYHALIKGAPSDGELQVLREGVVLEDGVTHPAGVHKIAKQGCNTLISVDIHEGRNRQVRRMFDAIGYTVLRLTRVSVAGISLDGIEVGQHRNLNHSELAGILQRTGHGETQQINRDGDGYEKA